MIHMFSHGYKAFSTCDPHYIILSFAYASIILVNRCTGAPCNSLLSLLCLKYSSGDEERSHGPSGRELYLSVFYRSLINNCTKGGLKMETFNREFLMLARAHDA